MFTIRYNRQTNHISGIEAKCTSTGEEKGGVVATYALSHCPTVSRGNLATGKSYATIQEAYEAASKHTRRICKTCAKAALALIAAEAEAAEQAPVEEPKPETVEGAEHQVGDKLFFLPGERPHGYVCPAGEVEVVRVVDHGDNVRFGQHRFTYVVQVPGIPATGQGTDASELHAPGSVPVDYRFEWTYLKAVCADCRQEVTYANTKMRREPIHRDGPVYHGMATHKELRVCAHH